MPKGSTYPVATSADAIDLLGVQGGVTKKLASTLLATQAELDAHLHTGTYAEPPSAADASVFVAATGNDADNGFSWGTAKATIAAAVALLPATGGTVFVSGDISIGAALSLSGKRGVILQGVGGKSSGAAVPAILRFTGTGSGSFINGQNTAGLAIRDLMILNTSASFTGSLVDLRNVGGLGSDTSGAVVENCYIGGVGVTSAIGVNLDYAISSQVRGCVFSQCAVAIQGRSVAAAYSNAIHVQNNVFTNNTAVIKNAGQAWLIDGNTFEPLTGGAAGAYTHDAGVVANDLTFTGNWFGDVTAAGAWITFAGNGLWVQGNYFGGSATATAILIDSGSCSGIIVLGNDFVTFSKALDYGATTNHTNCFFGFNSFSAVTTSLAGTRPNAQVEMTGAGTLINPAHQIKGTAALLEIRPNSGTTGQMEFIEDGVAERWSIGVKPADLNLYFYQGGTLAAGTERVRLDSSGFWRHSGAASTDSITAAIVPGDNQYRFIERVSGKLEWGNGADVQDTELSRTAVGTLGVGADDCLRTGRAVTASRPSAVTVGSGGWFYDTTLSKPIFSDGTVWRDAAGTAV